MAGIDRRMSGGEVDRMLGAYQQQAQKAEQQKQEKVFALQQAMNDPDQLVRCNVAAIAVRSEDGQRYLCAASTDGVRRDYPLSPQIEAMLLKALAAEEQAAA